MQQNNDSRLSGQEDSDKPIRVRPNRSNPMTMGHSIPNIFVPPVVLKYKNEKNKKADSPDMKRRIRRKIVQSQDNLKINDRNEFRPFEIEYFEDIVETRPRYNPLLNRCRSKPSSKNTQVRSTVKRRKLNDQERRPVRRSTSLNSPKTGITVRTENNKTSDSLQQTKIDSSQRSTPSTSANSSPISAVTDCNDNSARSRPNKIAQPQKTTLNSVEMNSSCSNRKRDEGDRPSQSRQDSRSETRLRSPSVKRQLDHSHAVIERFGISSHGDSTTLNPKDAARMPKSQNSNFSNNAPHSRVSRSSSASTQSNNGASTSHTKQSFSKINQAHNPSSATSKRLVQSSAFPTDQSKHPSSGTTEISKTRAVATNQAKGQAFTRPSSNAQTNNVAERPKLTAVDNLSKIGPTGATTSLQKRLPSLINPAPKIFSNQASTALQNSGATGPMDARSYPSTCASKSTNEKLAEHKTAVSTNSEVQIDDRLGRTSGVASASVWVDASQSGVKVNLPKVDKSTGTPSRQKLGRTATCMHFSNSIFSMKTHANELPIAEGNKPDKANTSTKDGERRCIPGQCETPSIYEDPLTDESLMRSVELLKLISIDAFDEKSKRNVKIALHGENSPIALEINKKPENHPLRYHRQQVLWKLLEKEIKPTKPQLAQESTQEHKPENPTIRVNRSAPVSRWASDNQSDKSSGEPVSKPAPQPRIVAHKSGSFTEKSQDEVRSSAARQKQAVPCSQSEKERFDRQRREYQDVRREQLRQQRKCEEASPPRGSKFNDMTNDPKTIRKKHQELIDAARRQFEAELKYKKRFGVPLHDESPYKRRWQYSSCSSPSSSASKSRMFGYSMSSSMKDQLLNQAQKDYEIQIKVLTDGKRLTVANCLHVLAVLESVKRDVNPLTALADLQVHTNGGGSHTPSHGSMKSYDMAKAAYRFALIKIHPDKNAHPQANRAFHLVQNAWTALNRTKR